MSAQVAILAAGLGAVVLWLTAFLIRVTSLTMAYSRNLSPYKNTLF